MKLDDYEIVFEKNLGWRGWLWSFEICFDREVMIHTTNKYRHRSEAEAAAWKTVQGYLDCSAKHEREVLSGPRLAERMGMGAIS